MAMSLQNDPTKKIANSPSIPVRYDQRLGRADTADGIFITLHNA